MIPKIVEGPARAKKTASKAGREKFFEKWTDFTTVENIIFNEGELFWEQNHKTIKYFRKLGGVGK